MRTLILVCLALLFCGGAYAKSSHLKHVELSKKEIHELKNISYWINNNLSLDDCSGLSYFAVFKDDSKLRLLGYEIMAECIESPNPRQYYYFDYQQRYQEPRH